MSKNVQSVLLSSALAGLMAGAVACGKKAEPEPAAPAATEAPAPEMAREASVGGGVHAENPAAAQMHACKGQNECKGQGGCKVEGQNECKGQNPCKGKGGCKTG